MVKIFVTEDNEIVRTALENLLNGQPDFTVVGTAADGRSALDQLEAGIATDVVLADLNMPHMNGFDLALALRAMPLSIIMLTMNERSEYVHRAAATGASGYVLKNGDFETLFSTVRRVASGEDCLLPWKPEQSF